MSWQAKLVLTGEDRIRWLNGMVTNNVRDLAPGHGVYSFLLSAQGRIQGDLVAYNRGDYLLVTTDREQAPAIAAIFDRYIIMDDVEVADVSDKLATIGVAGPKARQVLCDAGIAAEQLEPGQVIDTVWRDLGISVARSAQPPIDGYEIWLSAENGDKVWDALQSAGAEPVGSDALELYRIAKGVPRFGVDLRERDLPQETGQHYALNFAKGCYIGQEIVERIRSRGNVHRSLSGFEVDGDPPPAGHQGPRRRQRCRRDHQRSPGSVSKRRADLSAGISAARSWSSRDDRAGRRTNRHRRDTTFRRVVDNAQ